MQLSKFLLKNFSFFKKNSSREYRENLVSWPGFTFEDKGYDNFSDMAYIKNVIAYRAINMVAISVSSVPIVLYEITKGHRRKKLDHPLLKLIKQPNSLLSRVQFFENIVTYKLICGNAYILKTGFSKPTSLYLLRPDRIQVIPGENGFPKGYMYSINGNTYDYPVNSLKGISDILHLKNFHPLNDWYGLSPVEAAYYSIAQHNQAGAWNSSMLTNGARPSGALVVKTPGENNGFSLGKEQYERLREQINNYYTGSYNTGRPLLLEGGLEWKEMSLSPKDMDFIECKHSSARDIALAFGVPPQLLGIPGDNTYSNLVEARIALWEQTVLPMLENIIDNFNMWLKPYFGTNLQLAYDKDALEVLAVKREKLWSYVENASFMTINEKREAFGLPPIQEGDILKN